MGEYFKENTERPKDLQRLDAMARELVAVELLSSDDAEFMNEMDDIGEAIGYFYTVMVESGVDPEEVLQEYGVMEVDDEV